MVFGKHDVPSTLLFEIEAVAAVGGRSSDG